MLNSEVEGGSARVTGDSCRTPSNATRWGVDSAPRPPSRLCLWRLVGNQFHILDIGFDEPDLAILEINEGLSILDGIEFAGPENLCRLHLRSAVHTLTL